MKFSRVISVIVLVLSVIAFSCRKSDSTAPVVSLEGESTMSVVLNGSFTDPGATAQDNEDGRLNVNVSGTVNPDLAGAYVIKYSATDAAGNTGNAERIVNVLNSAAFLVGNYAATAYLTADTVYYQTSLVASTTLNKRVWLPGFAAYSQAVVYADVHADSLIVPQQDVVFGTPPVTRSFNGKGTEAIIGDSMIIHILFNETTSGNGNSGVVRFARKL
ncbi:MAG: DUF5011 domain-containing protein [Bacteroidota bacterium]